MTKEEKVYGWPRGAIFHAHRPKNSFCPPPTDLFLQSHCACDSGYWFTRLDDGSSRKQRSLHQPAGRLPIKHRSIMIPNWKRLLRSQSQDWFSSFVVITWVFNLSRLSVWLLPFPTLPWQLFLHFLREDDERADLTTRAQHEKSNHDH